MISCFRFVQPCCNEIWWIPIWPINGKNGGLFFKILIMKYGLLVEVAKILQLQKEITYAGLHGKP